MLARIVSAGLIAASLAASPARAQELADLRTYCMSDIERLCKGIEPGGGRILKCLKAHKKEMTVGCAQALQKLKARRH
jgi:Cysteine rich repeat